METSVMVYIGAIVAFLAIPFVIGYAWQYLEDQVNGFRRGGSALKPGFGYMPDED